MSFQSKLCLLIGIVLVQTIDVCATIKLKLNGDQIGKLYQGVYNVVEVLDGSLDSVDSRCIKLLSKDEHLIYFQITKKDIKQLHFYLRDEDGSPLVVSIAVQASNRFPPPALFFCSKRITDKDKICGLNDLSNSIIVKNPFGISENQSVFNYSVKEYYVKVYRNGKIIYEDDFRKHMFSFGNENIRKILRNIRADDVLEFSMMRIQDNFGVEYFIPSKIIRYKNNGWTGF